MFAPYTPLDRCVGKELRVRFQGEEYVGLLAGVYNLNSVPILVLTPMKGGGTEQHIPLQNAVITLTHDR